jgi:type IV secretory pathway VirB9-like protein
MRGQFPNVPKGIMMGMVAAQTKELNRTLNTKLREKAILVAEHKAATDEANAMMQFEMQVVAEERANRTETINYMKEKYAYLKKDEDWEKEKEFQKEQATLAYDR